MCFTRDELILMRNLASAKKQVKTRSSTVRMQEDNTQNNVILLNLASVCLLRQTVVVS